MEFITEVNNALLTYQKMATKGFFIELMSILEKYDLKNIELQYYPDTNPHGYNLIKGFNLLDEVLHRHSQENNIDYDLNKVENQYKNHLTQIMSYVYQVQHIDARKGHEFEFDIENFSQSARNFCGEELIQEIEKHHLESKIENPNFSKKFKV
jgi:hypothetical protein